MKEIIIAFILTILVFNLRGQDTIFLANPSFEGNPIKQTTPPGWKNYGKYEFPNESPPDHHPNNLFSVTESAKDGKCFVGLVTRDTRTWESIGQRLSKPLLKDKKYQLSLYLRLPQNYISVSRRTRREENFNQPVILRIWGGNKDYEKTELLGESVAVDHKTWEEYIFQLNPKMGDWNVISFEVFYKEGLMFPYNGSLLIDHCSPIQLLNNDLISTIQQLNSTQTDSLAKAEAILNFMIKNIDYQTNNSYLVKIKNLLILKEKLDKNSVKNFIFNQTPKEVLASIELLETFDLQSIANIVQKVHQIYTSKESELTDAQKDYFKNCESDFNAKYNEALIKQKTLHFIQKNQKEILNTRE